MTALVLVFCLQASPSSCVEERPIEGLPPLACIVHAQEYAASWLADHPKWMLARWRCEHNIPHREPI